MDNTPPVTSEGAPQSQGPLFQALALLIVIGIGAFGFYAYKNNLLTSLSTGGLPSIDMKASGTIYVTSAEKNDNAANIYTLNAATGELKKILDGNFLRYTPTLSPKGNMLAFTATPIDRKSGHFFPYSKPFQLVTFDLATHKETTITHDSIDAKRMPEWSPDSSKIAFTGDEESLGGADYFVPNNTGIFVSDLKGNVDKIESGSYAHWSPDGKKLLYLKNDGIYIIDLQSKKSEKVLPIIGKDGSNDMYFDVSRDYKKLVWNSSDSKELVAYTIDSWSPFSATQVKRIPTEETTFWPVFSSDGAFISAMEVDWDRANKVYINPRLIAYSWGTFGKQKLFDLKDFNLSLTFLSDWH